jgi:hypothetical protein
VTSGRRSLEALKGELKDTGSKAVVAALPKSLEKEPDQRHPGQLDPSEARTKLLFCPRFGRISRYLKTGTCVNLKGEDRLE